MHMRITCSVYRYVRRQSNIDNYWPGMNNTAFLVVFMDLYELGSFFKKCDGKTFYFLIYRCHVNVLVP